MDTGCIKERPQDRLLRNGVPAKVEGGLGGRGCGRSWSSRQGDPTSPAKSLLPLSTDQT